MKMQVYLLPGDGQVIGPTDYIIRIAEVAMQDPYCPRNGRRDGMKRYIWVGESGARQSSIGATGFS